MGMGKSLSILALVTQTLEESLRWAQTLPDGLDDSLSKKTRRSRATLVLVPSASMSYSKLNKVFRILTQAVLINEWLNEIKMYCVHF